jgi:predicted transcriptional regulator
LVWQVLKAIKAGKLTSPVSGWLLKKVVQVSEDTPINEVRDPSSIAKPSHQPLSSL